MAGKIKFIRAVTGGAAAVGILTLGIFPGFPLVDGLSQSSGMARHLDASKIVVDVRPHFAPSDYPCVYKVSNSDGTSGEFAQARETAEIKERDLSARDSVEVAVLADDSVDKPASSEPLVPAETVQPATSALSKPVVSEQSPASESAATKVIAEQASPDQTSPELASPEQTSPDQTLPDQPAPKASASSVPDICLVPVHDGSAILRITSTALLSFSSFCLKKPARLVIDVKGTFHHKGAAKIVLDASGVSRARAGRHPGTFRVVLDLVGADTPAPEIRATESGLEILAPQKTAKLDS